MNQWLSKEIWIIHALEQLKELNKHNVVKKYFCEKTMVIFPMSVYNIHSFAKCMIAASMTKHVKNGVKHPVLWCTIITLALSGYHINYKETSCLGDLTPI